MEDLRSQIKTRGLRTGGAQHPLIEFKGDFKGFEPEHDTRYNRVVVKLQFENIEVIASRTPYEFPVAEIRLGLSESTRSGWGVFAESAIPFYPSEVSELDSLFGKRLHLRYTGGHMMWNPQAAGGGAEEAREAWEIVGVEGVSSNGSTPNGSTPAPRETPMSRVLGLMEGKTQQEWAQAALRDPLVKTDSNLVSKLLNQSLVAELQGTGAVSKEGDRFKVNQEVLAALAG